jgi:hypothetical protein
VQQKLLLRQRFAQIGLQGGARRDFGLHLGSKKRSVLRPAALAWNMASSAA